MRLVWPILFGSHRSTAIDSRESLECSNLKFKFIWKWLFGIFPFKIAAAAHNWQMQFQSFYLERRIQSVWLRCVIAIERSLNGSQSTIFKRSVYCCYLRNSIILIIFISGAHWMAVNMNPYCFAALCSLNGRPTSALRLVSLSLSLSLSLQVNLFVRIY